MWGFTITLGYSRRMMAEAAMNQKLGSLLRMHERAFEELGGVTDAGALKSTMIFNSVDTAALEACCSLAFDWETAARPALLRYTYRPSHRQE